MNQHPIFVKYTRDWLHQVTGFSKGYLSRVATGKDPLRRSFIERVCFRLNQLETELFLNDGTQPTQCHEPWGCAEGSLSHWLQEQCQGEHLSSRQAAAKAGVSHATIADILKGRRPAPETIRKLAQGFGGDGTQRLALEDKLLVLAGYRSERQGEESSELVAQLRDKERQLNDPQLRIMVKFADFLIEAAKEGRASHPR